MRPTKFYFNRTFTGDAFSSGYLVRVFYLIVYRYLKTVIIMANVELTFFGTSEDSYQTKLVCGKNNHNNIYIRITDRFNEDSFEFITIDKSTAIRLAKTLRTEINKLT